MEQVSFNGIEEKLIDFSDVVGMCVFRLLCERGAFVFGLINNERVVYE